MSFKADNSECGAGFGAARAAGRAWVSDSWSPFTPSTRMRMIDGIEYSRHCTVQFSPHSSKCSANFEELKWWKPSAAGSPGTSREDLAVANSTVNGGVISATALPPKKRHMVKSWNMGFQDGFTIKAVMANGAPATCPPAQRKSKSTSALAALTLPSWRVNSLRRPVMRSTACAFACKRQVLRPRTWQDQGSMSSPSNGEPSSAMAGMTNSDPSWTSDTVGKRIPERKKPCRNVGSRTEPPVPSDQWLRIARGTASPTGAVEDAAAAAAVRWRSEWRAR
mmetsp:Transcript_53660/g.154715  ORF Transcript_53660/g.154715 Transcript_53660/m.154715 type:complete len:279 (+) Transcript_53660:919-1755(+)